MRIAVGKIRKLIKEATAIESDRLADADDMCEDDIALWEEDDLDEVAPKGYEKVVKGLKKNKDVDNPWAVAYSMKKKGIRPKK